MTGSPARQSVSPPKQPGAALRRVRERSGLSLVEVSRRTGIPVSILSRMENGKVGLSYRRLAQISEGLEIDVSRLFEAAQDAPATGRRSVCRAGEPGAPHPGADLLNKRLSPRVLHLGPAASQEAPPLERLAGEVYAYVVDGAAVLHTDLYAPLRLETGDSIYFDGATGHAWASAGAAPCRVLTVSSRDDA
jgi:transcriptional regulator with XRE-family HTH domain